MRMIIRFLEATRLCTKSRKRVNHSAKGAEYDSQGQARSASPLGTNQIFYLALKRAQ